MCRRPKLGKGENESAVGKGGTVSLLILYCVLAVFIIIIIITIIIIIIIFDQLRSLSRVVNSVGETKLMLGIHRPEFARWNFILANFCTGLFKNNNRRNLELKTLQIRGGHRSYVT